MRHFGGTKPKRPTFPRIKKIQAAYPAYLTPAVAPLGWLRLIPIIRPSRWRLVNPHNQTFAVAIQIGLLGAIVLWAMWIAHFRLFRGEGILAWLGTMIVVENIVSSFVHSHLFDSAHGWLYVFGIGVLGG